MPYKEGRKWRASVICEGERWTSLKNTKQEAKEWEIKKKKELKIAEKQSSRMSCLSFCSKYLDYSCRYSKATFNDKVSTHGMALLETLTLSEKLDINSKIVIVGIQPYDVSFGLELTKPMEKKITPVVEKVMELI